MEIGNDVILQKFDGDNVYEFDAFVIGVDGDALSLAYFDKSKAHFLGGVDWRLAFERLDGVKPASHDDVKDGKEGFAYRLETAESLDPVEEAPEPQAVVEVSEPEESH